MTAAGKWNYEKQKYEPYELPEGACLYSDDLDAVISCARCGKKITYGSGYTSRQIHTPHGLGYAVCMDCYDKEMEEEATYEKGNQGR